MTRLARTVIAALAALAVMVVTAGPRAGHAGGTEFLTERAISRHIDRARYSGRLDAGRLDELVARGAALFAAKFTVHDGAGRPMATQAIIPTKVARPRAQAFQRISGPDANSCASCHNEPVDGGAGDFTVNVFVAEGFNNPDFDTTDQQFSNERNTNHLMGAGLVELLAREMTAELQHARAGALAESRRSGSPVRARLVTKGVDFGALTALPDGFVELAELDGVDDDLVVRPFSQKGVMTSLRQFTINALNHHHGIQASERFGARWTGEADFDEDGHADEFSPGDISAMVAFQASLEPPVKRVPDDPGWRTAARRGDELFAAIGCASCHRPALPLESLDFVDPGPSDAAGTLRRGEVDEPAIYDLALRDWAQTLPRDGDGDVLVPLYGDLKRHGMSDRQVAALGNELLSQRFVERDVFQTTELWGIGSTAPYGHRGDFTTLDDVIRAHGGEARAAREAYIGLSDRDRGAVIAFLGTLVIAP